MSFRWTTLTWPAVAVLALIGISNAHGQSAAQGQAAGHGEPILFSSPDGQSVSNSTVPSALAPEPPKPAVGKPAPAAVVFNPQAGAPMPISPEMVVFAPDNSQSPTDPRRELTPAQIMGVQTMQQIFGLSERQDLAAPNPPAVSQNGNTNVIFSGASSAEKPAFGQSDWAKLFTGTTETNADRPDNSQDLFGGVFSHPAGRSFFGSDAGNSEQGLFGSPQPPQPAQPPDSGLFPGFANSGGLSQNNSQSSINSGLNPQLSEPQSPFAPPQSTSVATLPKLPQIQTAPGQSFQTAPAAPPSWAPKPPPWASSQRLPPP